LPRAVRPRPRPLATDSPGLPVTPSAAAGAVAHRLWNQAAGTASAPMATVLVAERLIEQLRANLARWIGVNGSQVLVRRAIRLVSGQHPALASLPFLNAPGDAQAPAQVAPSARSVRAGVIALLAMVTELLGHLIGAEIAESLVQQTFVPSPRGAVSQGTSQGRRHG
jgi:hypothetical protein